MKFIDEFKHDGEIYASYAALIYSEIVDMKKLKLLVQSDVDVFAYYSVWGVIDSPGKRMTEEKLHLWPCRPPDKIKSTTTRCGHVVSESYDNITWRDCYFKKSDLEKYGLIKPKKRPVEDVIKELGPDAKLIYNRVKKEPENKHTRHDVALSFHKKMGLKNITTQDIQLDVFDTLTNLEMRIPTKLIQKALTRLGYETLGQNKINKILKK